MTFFIFVGYCYFISLVVTEAVMFSLLEVFMFLHFLKTVGSWLVINSADGIV